MYCNKKPQPRTETRPQSVNFHYQVRTYHFFLHPYHLHKQTATRKLINYEDLRRQRSEGSQINHFVYRSTVDRRPRRRAMENKHVWIVWLALQLGGELCLLIKWNCVFNEMLSCYPYLMRLLELARVFGMNWDIQNRKW